MAEARRACQVLGLNDSSLVFLGHHDGQLMNHQMVVIDQVKGLIVKSNPDVIYIPYYLEPPLDHLATNQIVHQALRYLNWNGRIFEYPVWFWYHWPWVGLPKRGIHKIANAIYQSYCFQVKFVQDFNCTKTVVDVQAIKKRALAEYRSQMTRVIPDRKWAILEDVANGDFLKLFFQPKELFYSYNYPL
jgi:LmbE family N-acetylglucosaminyl deacetylase